MKDYEIEVVRQNTRSLTINVLDSDGTIVDLSGFAMLMTVKKQAEDTDANAIIGPITATITSPTTGIGIIDLTSVHTDVVAREYIYDIQIDDGTNRFTIVGPSKFTIIENVTKG